MVIPAHNEEMVLADLLENLKMLKYPKELYDVYVIADNCTDHTADIARAHGAHVFERTNRELVGKGYAMDWVFPKIFALNKGYDAFCVFDSDNLVHLDFLAVMNNRLLKGQKVLMEGAQGALLDLDSGTYPYVSSGMSCSAGAAIGSGIGPRALDRVLGVFKAYSTRVGNGPMPTEFDEESQSELYRFVRDTGREYGVTTGRPRRCGYLDLVALRHACHTNSIDGLVLTHLDIYDTLEEIEACVAYEIDGTEVTDFPASIPQLNRAKPVLKKFAGWKTPLKNCKSYQELHPAARSYVEFIEAYTATSVDIISVGYERSETFIRRNPWEK